MVSRRVAWVAVALLALSAGCAGIDLPAGVDEPPTVTGEEQPAEVTDVVDGDTVDVRYLGGETDRVRLLGVDTPEVHVENEAADFEGVPPTDAGEACLRAAGENASEYVRDRLAGTEVTLVVDSTADRRDRYDRLLAYVEVDGTDLNYALVADGQARVYDTEFARSDRYYEAESEAQDAGTGVWGCREPGDGAAANGTADGDFVVVEVHADAAGNDHENLNDEYVVFRNDGDDPLDLSGWTVSDEGGHEYVFPDGVALEPGETVTLRSGAGEDGSGEGGDGTTASGADDHDLYWGSDSAIWNNGGDAVFVTDAEGRLVVERSYGE